VFCTTLECVCISKIKLWRRILISGENSVQIFESEWINVVIRESAVLFVLHVLSFSCSERTVVRIGDQLSNKKKKGSRRTIKRTWRKKLKKGGDKIGERERTEDKKTNNIFFIMSSP